MTRDDSIDLATARAVRLAGPLPMFEVALKETFNYYGVAEFDFQAIADASKNIGTISLSE